MSNFDNYGNKKYEREKVKREKKAVYCYDMAKLCFGGLVIASIIRIPTSEDKVSILIFLLLGISATIIFTIMAN